MKASTAAYIRSKLGGKAKVVLPTHDSLQFLAPRFTAMRTILLAQPNVDVVLGTDWLEGKSVPQAMDILPNALTAQNMAQYERDVADPARRASYLKMYGNICYDTRERYLNFPWSSKRK